MLTHFGRNKDTQKVPEAASTPHTAGLNSVFQQVYAYEELSSLVALFKVFLRFLSSGGSDMEVPQLPFSFLFLRILALRVKVFKILNYS